MSATQNKNLPVPNFNQVGWSDDMQAIFDAIDAYIKHLQLDGSIDEVITPKITLPDGTITSAANIGGTAQTLAQAMALGKEADLDGVDFALKDGARDLLRIDSKKGLAGMVGNIMTPLVHIPFKRANDELALSGTQTYSRASTATYIDPLDGFLKTAAIDEPVFEKCSDGVVRQRFEPASTNLLLHSNNLMQWTTFGTAPTVTANSADVTDIFGTNTANKIVFAATAGGVGQVVTVTQGLPLTPSIWLRTASGTVTCQLRDGSQVLQNITVTSTWQRFELPGTASATTYNFDIYDPTGNAGTIYACEGQLEELPFASSNITTTTTAVTRAADSAVTIPVSGNFPTLDYTKDFCVVLDYESPDADSVASGMTTQLLSVGGMGHVLMRHGVSFADVALIYLGSNNALSIPRAIASANQAHRFALVNRNGTMEAWFDNVLVGTRASTAITGSPLNISIGGGYGYSRIGNLRIYEYAPTATELGAI